MAKTETQFAWYTFVSPGLRVLDSGQVTYKLCLGRHEAYSTSSDLLCSAVNRQPQLHVLVLGTASLLPPSPR